MNNYNVTSLARSSGHPKSLIEKKIWLGEIPVTNGLIEEDASERILEERRKYISLAEYAAGRISDSFAGKSKDKEKLLSFLEDNGFFGIRHIAFSDILMGTKTDCLYFERKDLPYLDECLEEFFEGLSFTGKDRVDRMMAKAKKAHPATCKMLEAFTETCMEGRNDYPPSYVDFVRAMTHLPDLPDLETSDIKEYLKRDLSRSCKEYIVRFLNESRARIPVKYGDVVLKAAPRNSIPSYTNETYISLMKCIFNSEYIDDHKMIEKALAYHLYAEAWLYIALFAACGWRAADVCRGWRYLRLHEREETLFGIDRSTLYDDLLNDKIPDKVYEDVCIYCISDVDASGSLPEKNNLLNPPPLRAVIRPELRTFYGMLTLIGEAHMLRTGDGYMKPNRAFDYQNKVLLRKFFGKEIIEILHGENIQSRRLNKVFLQGTEDAARKNGNSGIMAAMAAGYARNHTSMDTIMHYISDHQLTGETAEMVAYFMMERGVFGFLYYQTLLLAYPETLKKLPMEKQNELIAIMDEKPLELELKQSEIAGRRYIQEQYKKGNTEAVTKMMETMLEISQGRGKAKDKGLYCLKRARGEACHHPEYESCLAGCCPYMVFTSMALIPLLKVLKSYMDKAATDIKAKAVLNKVMIPFYQDIINRLARTANLDRADGEGIKKIMKEVLDG